MPKTKEELNALKIEFESLKLKLNELTDDGITLVTGGSLELKPDTLESEMSCDDPGIKDFDMICPGP